MFYHPSYVQYHGLQKNSNNKADNDKSLHAVTEPEL